MQGLANAPFGDVSSSTAVALFLPTTATTLAAVIVLRSLSHPKRGGSLLCIAAWLTIVAFCSSFFSWYFERAESAPGTSTYLWAASVLSILVSVVFVAAGLLEILAAIVREGTAAQQTVLNATMLVQLRPPERCRATPEARIPELAR